MIKAKAGDRIGIAVLLCGIFLDNDGEQ